jgi:hypothetical protein
VWGGEYERASVGVSACVVRARRGAESRKEEKQVEKSGCWDWSRHGHSCVAMDARTESSRSHGTTEQRVWQPCCISRAQVASSSPRPTTPPAGPHSPPTAAEQVARDGASL